MDKIFFLLIALAGVMLSSCSATGEPAHKSEEDTVAVEAEPAEVAPSREAIFVYGEQKAVRKRVTLTFGSQPILLLSGYVRLAGVVRGESPTALVEIGGGGLAVGLGDEVDGYRVSRIEGDKVVLVKRREIE
jgi:hypothetical protein